MTTVETLYIPQGDSRADLVFVHGLGSNPDGAFGSTDAPGWFQWLPEDLPDIALWTLAYEAPWSRWQKIDAPPLIEIALEALALLKGRGLGRRPIIFVAHSLGGLLVKQMLISIDCFAVDYRDILSGARGLVFLSTPHAGADAATWARYLGALIRPSRATLVLEAHHPFLRFLNLTYRNRVGQWGLASLVFYEEVPFLGVTVVSAAFADPGVPAVTPIPVARNHFDIAKPASREDVVYSRTVDFVRDALAGRSGLRPSGARVPKDDQLRNILTGVGLSWRAALIDAETAGLEVREHLNRAQIDAPLVSLPPEVEFLIPPRAKGILDLHEGFLEQADVICAYEDLAGAIEAAVQTFNAVSALCFALLRLVHPLTTAALIGRLFGGTVIEREVSRKLVTEEDEAIFAELRSRYPDVLDLSCHEPYVADITRSKNEAAEAARRLETAAHYAVNTIDKYALRLGVRLKEGD